LIDSDFTLILYLFGVWSNLIAFFKLDEVDSTLFLLSTIWGKLVVSLSFFENLSRELFLNFFKLFIEGDYFKDFL
jgi:hypothetical protein